MANIRSDKTQIGELGSLEDASYAFYAVAYHLDVFQGANTFLRGSLDVEDGCGLKTHYF